MTNDPIATIVALAKLQVGYREGRSNGHWNNHNKYAPDLPDLAWSQNQPWCAVFVSWLADQTGNRAYYPRTASVPAAEQWGHDNHSWSEYPAVGAQVIIGNKAHTGIVVAYDDNTITTVEGNTNTDGSAEGNGVYLRTRMRRSSTVRGYVYPKIPGVVLRSADPNYHPFLTPSYYRVKTGDTLTSIAAANGINVDELVALNKLLHVGDNLKVRK